MKYCTTTAAILAVAVVLTVLLGSETTSFASAATLKLRERPKKGVPVSKEWRATLAQLLKMMAGDKEFHFALEQFAKESGDTPVEYCLVEGIRCDKKGEIEVMAIENMQGKVDFSAIPKSVQELTFNKGKLKQEPEFSTLPAQIRKLTFKNVRFEQVSEVSLNFKKGQLRAFTCVDCGFSEMDWSTIPALMALDLSHNPLSQVDFTKLPRTLRTLNVSNCGLALDASKAIDFPPSLTSIDVSHNSIKGSLGWTFPAYLEKFFAGNNHLDGSPAFDKFPASLVGLVMPNNNFEGELKDLTSLVGLKIVDLGGNKLTQINFEKLPSSLKQLRVPQNELEGHLDVKHLPQGLSVLDVSGNKLTGSIDISALPKGLEHLDLSTNAFSGAIDLKVFKPAIRFVFLQHNKFTGKPDVTRLPVDLRRILFYDNKWDLMLPPEHHPLDDL